MGYYAVHKGRAPGVYKTWDACKTQIHGYSGAIFKRFDNPWSAEKFVGTGPLPKKQQRKLFFVNP